MLPLRPAPVITLFITALFIAATAAFPQPSPAKRVIKGKIIDATTNEPVAGASLQCDMEGCRCGCTSNSAGEFEMACFDCKNVLVSSMGFAGYQFKVSAPPSLIKLSRSQSLLHEIVVSANRGEGMKRSEAPVAIGIINNQTLQDAKPATADQVLNKISGVNMVSLGNEQHQMSIRQPMTTRSLFLYLEDGIPIRTTGLFNHNALLEMNLAATRSIEVIKGPSSSLYGSEAIGGVVNFITAAPSATPVLKVSAQGNNIGYKRGDLIAGYSKGKLGMMLSGYYADKKNGYLEYSDYRKGTLTGRIDYRFSERTLLSNSITWTDYYSDMSGGVDSIMFANRSFQNLHSFTYRKVHALRYHSSLSHEWSEAGKTTLTLMYRNNSIGQNPAYRVKDDYRRVNGAFIGEKDLAHGEINESSFTSYALIAQHKQQLKWKKAVLIGGVNIDLSPSGYHASYIRISKDTASRKYTSYTATDSILTNYSTRLNNYAAFANIELSPVEKLRVVASLRYDMFHYDFNNHLSPSAFSGSPDTVNRFQRFSPKLGLTYNFSSRSGVYANYSEGFVPPQVTELYTGVQVPSIEPSVFYNYEAGGWAELFRGRLSADISAYILNGVNEIVSVKLDDGSYANRNTGKTSHRGIEFGLNATPARGLSLRFSGAYSRHRFIEYEERGAKYNGNEMNNAPNWIYNTEVWYKPAYVKGLRLGVELQHIGSYYADAMNTAKYEGYRVLHCRAGYQAGAIELWVNVMNVTNRYYSYITTKSSFGYSYQLAEPRNINIGVSYNFAALFNKEKK